VVVSLEISPEASTSIFWSGRRGPRVVTWAMCGLLVRCGHPVDVVGQSFQVPPTPGRGLAAELAFRAHLAAIRVTSSANAES